MRIERYRKTRYWAVVDAADTLVCLCVYRKGALEVARRLQQALDDAQQWQDRNGPAEDPGKHHSGHVRCGSGNLGSVTQALPLYPLQQEE